MVDTIVKYLSHRLNKKLKKYCYLFLYKYIIKNSKWDYGNKFLVKI